MSKRDDFQTSLSTVKTALRTLFQAGQQRDQLSLLADASLLLEHTLNEARRVGATESVGPLVEALQILQEAQKPSVNGAHRGPPAARQPGEGTHRAAD